MQAAGRKRPRRGERGQAAGLDDDAVDAAGQRRGGGLPHGDATCGRTLGEEHFVLVAEALSARCWARRPRCSSASAARSWWSATAATRARSSRSTTASRARCRSSPTTFVTTEDGTGHRAPRAGVRRGRLPRRGGRGDLPGRRTAHAVQPGQAGRHLRRPRAQPRRPLVRGPLRQGPRADAGADRGPRRARPAAARARTTSTPTPTAGAAARRCLLRETVVVHRARRSCATSCSRRTRRSTGIRRASRRDASGTG